MEFTVSNQQIQTEDALPLEKYDSRPFVFKYKIYAQNITVLSNKIQASNLNHKLLPCPFFHFFVKKIGIIIILLECKIILNTDEKKISSLDPHLRDKLRS